MSKGHCYMCIHRQNWRDLFRILLRLVAKPSELKSLGFAHPLIYQKTSESVYESHDKWLLICSFLDGKLEQTSSLTKYSIVQLLELWSMEAKQASVETISTLLWALLRRKEKCPYRICAKLLQQVEELALVSLSEHRVA